MWKKRLQTGLWCVLWVATFVLLVAAMRKKDQRVCADIVIKITGSGDSLFVDENDVKNVLQVNNAVTSTPVAGIQLKKIETALEKNPWVKNAELFFDNNQALRVNIEEREPLARVFTVQGTSFYIDSAGYRLPLSDRVTVRVPMFTSFPSDNKVLSGPDSAVLNDLKSIAQYIQKDSFWMAQVAQVDITDHGTYEVIPVLGNQVIELGNAEDLDEKFSKLHAFYQQVWSKMGFEKYEKIDVQYHNQVVATRRGAPKPFADSLMAMQQINNVHDKMNAMMVDSATAAKKTAMPPVKDSVTAGVAVKPTIKSNSTNNAVAMNKTAKKTNNKKTNKKPKASAKKPKAVMSKVA
jgi:cell division protein FtsQ